MVRTLGLIVVVGVLSGCVQVPPVPPAMLVAYPGQGRTEAVFRTDDAACQGEAARWGAAAGAPVAAGEAVEGLSPGQVYLRCMAMRGNVVQPMVASMPAAVVYRSYLAYPVYSGFGDYSPWLYGGYGGFGYYGRFGGYRGFYGNREGYGFRGGFREGGFRGGDGFHWGRR